MFHFVVTKPQGFEIMMLGYHPDNTTFDNSLADTVLALHADKVMAGSGSKKKKRQGEDGDGRESLRLKINVKNGQNEKT